MASGGKATLGSEWTYAIYFDPEADNNEGVIHKVEDDELIKQFKKQVKKDEKIEEVFAYKTPVTRVQATDIVLHHLFIIFKTRHWSWSIEKNEKGITIQRSKQLTAVLNRSRQKERLSKIKKVAFDEGRLSVLDLITWLYQSNELNKKYNFLTSNCQHFAKAVFDYVAKEKYL